MRWVPVLIALLACGERQAPVEPPPEPTAPAPTPPPPGVSDDDTEDPEDALEDDEDEEGTAAPRQRRAAPSPPAGDPLDLRIEYCVPVGYGNLCPSEVISEDPALAGPASLSACVGDGDGARLIRHLDGAPLVGAPAPPLSLNLRVVPAEDPPGHCGVLHLDSGDSLRVVGVER